LRAQVHDITEREVIEAFSCGILAKWQFHDFGKENLRSNEEFKRMVEKMIAAEEKPRKDFQIETIGTTLTHETIKATSSRAESADPTTPWP
jgi:hypothetical protein